MISSKKFFGYLRIECLERVAEDKKPYLYLDRQKVF